MRFPLHITLDTVKHQMKNALQGNERYPFVMMLEPLWTCNLACIGCSVERHTGKLEDRVPVERCLEAAEECDAPLVSVCGGEPTVYPELRELIDGLIEQKRHVYLCTNALLMEKRVWGKIEPHKRLSINVHLDGLKETHDYVTDREGVFEKAIEGIKGSLERGFHTITNTTVYKETDIGEVRELFDLLSEIGVDGMLLSPGYQYESVDRDVFLTQEDTERKFRQVLEFADDYNITSTPMFLEFAAGLRDYDCSPWSTVTFTPKGWKGPCYLIGKNHYETFEEFWNETDWEYWESREDDLCQNCKMHSGFEASVVQELPESPGDMLRLAKWNLSA
jgi:hopanoid biosynthesis associated radical SAM protein HpnH